jgi:hypothetical protein
VVCIQGRVDSREGPEEAERIAAVEPKLSYLTVSVADESRIDGLVVTRNTQPLDAALWNRAIPVDGGTYVISGRAPGHEEWSTTVEVPKQLGKVSVEVPRFKELAKLVTSPTPNAETPQPDGEPVDEVPGETPSLFTPKRKLAVGVAAVGVVALAGGIVFGMQAKGYEDDAFALCPNPATACPDGNRANDLISKGDSRAMLANISFGVGAAAIIGGGVLWFLGAPTSSEATVAVTPRGGKSSAGLDLTVRF